MGMYAYKDVVHRIPEHITAQIEGYEGEPNYDGDAWTATSLWIDELQARIKELEAAATTPTLALTGEERDWLTMQMHADAPDPCDCRSCRIAAALLARTATAPATSQEDAAHPDVDKALARIGACFLKRTWPTGGAAEELHRHFVQHGSVELWDRARALAGDADARGKE